MRLGRLRTELPEDTGGDLAHLHVLYHAVKRGGLKEAMQFADHLRDNFLPGCYVETSTKGL
jgi:hypothetical protein